MSAPTPTGSLAIRLTEVESEAPLFTLSHHVPGTDLSENEIIVQNWGVNEGIVPALVERGFIEPTGRTVTAGRYEAPIMRLVPTP